MGLTDERGGSPSRAVGLTSGGGEPLLGPPRFLPPHVPAPCGSRVPGACTAALNAAFPAAPCAPPLGLLTRKARPPGPESCVHEPRCPRGRAARPSRAERLPQGWGGTGGDGAPGELPRRAPFPRVSHVGAFRVRTSCGEPPSLCPRLAAGAPVGLPQAARRAGASRDRKRAVKIPLTSGGTVQSRGL